VIFLYVLRTGRSWGIIIPNKILKKLEWKYKDKIGFDLQNEKLVLQKLKNQDRSDNGRFVLIRKIGASFGFQKKGLFAILEWKPATKIKYVVRNDRLFLTCV